MLYFEILKTSMPNLTQTQCLWSPTTFHLHLADISHSTSPDFIIDNSCSTLIHVPNFQFVSLLYKSFSLLCSDMWPTCIKTHCITWIQIIQVLFFVLHVLSHMPHSKSTLVVLCSTLTLIFSWTLVLAHCLDLAAADWTAATLTFNFWTCWTGLS